MQVSVIIAACEAHGTIARAVRSLLVQTWADFEAIIVADDGRDYLALLAREGVADARLRQVSSGGVATGCGHARNRGLAAATGGFVTRLDADDTFDPRRLARLLPIAAREGWAADTLDVIDDATGRTLWRPFAADPPERELTLGDLAGLNCPLVPLVRRDHALPWFEHVDIAEDVLFLVALFGRLRRLTIVADPLYRYHVRTGSMCHGPDGAERADRSYAAIDARLAQGAFAGIGPALVPTARRIFAAKRAFNLAFATAEAAGECANFQEFCARSEAALPPA